MTEPATNVERGRAAYRRRDWNEASTALEAVDREIALELPDLELFVCSAWR